jgi:hypothetical protein
VQSEEAIQVDDALLPVARTRNGDAGAHAVIGLLAVRHHDVEAVCCAALEEDDQAFLARGCGLRGVNSARKEAGNDAGAHDGQRTVLQKNSASDRHLLLLKS